MKILGLIMAIIGVVIWGWMCIANVYYGMTFGVYLLIPLLMAGGGLSLYADER